MDRRTGGSSGIRSGNYLSHQHDPYHHMEPYGPPLNKYPQSSFYPYSSTNDLKREKTAEKPKEEEEETSFNNNVLGVFAGRTSLVGMAYMREPKYLVVRLIWILIFLGGVGAACWQLSGVFQKYFSHPIKTEISIGFSSLDFPSITVCNVNPLRDSYTHLDDKLQNFMDNIETEFENAQSELEMYDWWNYGDESDNDVDVTDTERKKRNAINKRTDTKTKYRRNRRNARKRREGDEANSTEDIEDEYYYYYYDWYDYADYYGDDYYSYIGEGESSEEEQMAAAFHNIVGKISRENRTKMGHQKELTILSCSYHGIQCSASDFSTILSANYGNCFRFNTPDTRKKPLRSKRSGIRNGLSLVLYLDKPEYLDGYTEEQGFRISVDPFNTMTAPEDTGVSVAPGFETSIGLQILNITRLGEPYWQCETGDKFKEYYGFEYTVQGCIATCSELLISRECSCVRPEYLDFVPKVNRTLPSCLDSDAGKECARKVATSVTTGATGCTCNHPCREYAFSEQNSILAWPTSSMWFHLLQMLCTAEQNFTETTEDLSKSCEHFATVSDRHDQRELLRTNFARVNIYYSSLNFENINQAEDYPVTQFGADIGGTIGLWVGFSIFTGVELLDLLIQIVIYFAYTKQKSKKGSEPTSPSPPEPRPYPPPLHHQHPGYANRY